MKPRASAPSTRSQFFCAHPRRRARRPSRGARRVGEQRRDVLEADAGRREVLDLPDLARRSSRSLRRQLSQVAPEEQRATAPRELGELTAGRAAPARGARRCGRAAPARRAARAAPPRRPVAVRNVRRWRGVDAVARELRAGRGDVGVRLGVALLARRCRAARAARTPRAPSRAPASMPARSQSSSSVIVSSRSPSAAGRRRLRSFAPGASSSSRITRSGRNSSRCSRRIVCSRSRSCLAEEPVAALRAPRREQALVLEVADLRDRDVRELVAQAAHDLADPEQALALLGRRPSIVMR